MKYSCVLHGMLRHLRALNGVVPREIKSLLGTIERHEINPEKPKVKKELEEAKSFLDYLHKLVQHRMTTTFLSRSEAILSHLKRCSPQDCGLIAFYCGKLGVKSEAIWDLLEYRVKDKPLEPRILARFIHALSKLEIKPEFAKTLTDQILSKPSLNEKDIVMTIAVLTKQQKDSPHLQSLMEKLIELKPRLPASAQVVVFNALPNISLSAEQLEYIYEQTRHLHLEPSFNDRMCREIAVKAAALKMKDPRLLYQMIYFAKTHTVRKNFYIDFLQAYARLGIQDEKVWNRFGNRLEKLGAEMTLQELRKINYCFKRAKSLNQRTHGVIQLYLGLKEDIEVTGSKLFLKHLSEID